MPCLICSLAASSVLKTRLLSRRNPARWVSSSRKVMVSMPGPLTQSGGRNGQIPAVDAAMVPGQRLQDGNRGEHLADAEDIHHDVRSHGELRRVCGRAGKAGGSNFRLTDERHVADDVSPELAIDAARQPASEMHARGAQALPAEPAGAGVAAGPARPPRRRSQKGTTRPAPPPRARLPRSGLPPRTTPAPAAVSPRHDARTRSGASYFS